MDTHKKMNENISALVDGELPDSERELAFAALDTEEGRAAWYAYHLAGDVLRNTATGELSDGFGAALAARLAGEPAYASGAPSSAQAGSNGQAGDPPAPQDQAESSADVMLP